MRNDPAKEAVAAREELQQTMLDCATALTNAAEVMAWLATMSTGVTPKTANISAMSADRTVVASWGLLGVIPVKWSGPGLNLDSPKVATETLELAHHGFTDAKPVS